MVRNKATSLLLVCLVLFLACVPRSAPVSTPGAFVQFKETFDGVCKVWRAIRPHYAAARILAIELRQQGRIPDDLWTAFEWIDEHAPQLDRGLQLICDRDAGAQNDHVIAAERNRIDWNAIGANVLKVAAFAIESGLLK